MSMRQVAAKAAAPPKNSFGEFSFLIRTARSGCVLHLSRTHIYVNVSVRQRSKAKAKR